MENAIERKRKLSSSEGSQNKKAKNDELKRRLQQQRLNYNYYVSLSKNNFNKKKENKEFKQLSERLQRRIAEMRNIKTENEEAKKEAQKNFLKKYPRILQEGTNSVINLGENNKGKHLGFFFPSREKMSQHLNQEKSMIGTVNIFSTKKNDAAARIHMNRYNIPNANGRGERSNYYRAIESLAPQDSKVVLFTKMFGNQQGKRNFTKLNGGYTGGVIFFPSYNRWHSSPNYQSGRSVIITSHYVPPHIRQQIKNHAVSLNNVQFVTKPNNLGNIREKSKRMY